jgi:O-antigen/teichoic acid export membrane protein
LNLRRNVVWNVIEVASTSVVLFLLYRLIAMRLGIDSVGVWSLVLATTSLARFADAGLAAGLSRFVATSLQEGKTRQASQFVETALLANGILFTVLGLAIYYPLYWALPQVMDAKYVAQARGLLPFAVASLVMINLGSVITSAMIGISRSDLKSKLTLITSVLQLVVSLAMIGRLGLNAVAIAQILQNGLLVVIGWVLFARHSSGRLVPRAINYQRLRELLGFGVRLQLLSVTSLLYEPLIKFVMSATAGVAALGLFEMAWRAILQLRQILVVPTQNLVPMFAVAEGAEAMEKIHERATAMISAASVLGLGAFAVFSPIVSYLWLGAINWEFVTYVVILVPGWILNTGSTSGFLLGVGKGVLRWNLIASVTTSILALVFTTVLARYLGGVGVAIGASLAIGGSSLIHWVMNCRAFGVRPFPAGRSVLSLGR